MSAVIETRDLRKTYGRVEALKGVSIRVEPGEIYGLLGQNGAGKTTLIKILLGIVQESDGTLWCHREHASGSPCRNPFNIFPLAANPLQLPSSNSGGEPCRQ